MNCADACHQSNSLYFTNSGPQLGQFQAGALAAVIGAELSVMTGALIILLIVAVLVARFPACATIGSAPTSLFKPLERASGSSERV